MLARRAIWLRLCRDTPTRGCARARFRRARRSRRAPGQPTGAPDPTASSPRSAPWRATRHALRLAGTDLRPHGASSAHDAPLPLVGSEGAQPPAKPLPGTHGVWPQRVGWLSHLTVAQASPEARRETLPARRPEQPRPGRRGQAPRPLGRQPHGRRGRTGRPVTPPRRRHLLPHGPFPPYPYPSGTGDRRSWAILRPVSTPKCLRNAPKRPPSPVAGSSQLPAAAYRCVTYSLHACMTSARRSSRSERWYACTTWLLGTWARQASATSAGTPVSAIHDRALDRNP